MRNLFSENLKLKLEQEKIKKKVVDNSRNIELVFSYLDELLGKKENERPIAKIGYKK